MMRKKIWIMINATKSLKVFEQRIFEEMRVKAPLHGQKNTGFSQEMPEEREMNRQRRILTAALVLIGLTGEIADSTPAAAASHYPLWVCEGRYGGWGWSRTFSGLTFEALFRASATPQGYEYWYPAYSYEPYAYAYPYPRPFGIHVHECGYWWWGLR
jgi:hypothetical protein